MVVVVKGGVGGFWKVGNWADWVIEVAPTEGRLSARGREPTISGFLTITRKRSLPSSQCGLCHLIRHTSGYLVPGYVWPKIKVYALINSHAAVPCLWLNRFFGHEWGYANFPRATTCYLTKPCATPSWMMSTRDIAACFCFRINLFAGRSASALLRSRMVYPS